MNNQIDQLFQQARESEPELNSGGFMAGLGRELNAAPVIAEPKFEWLTVVAAALAMLIVFFATPLSGWIVAIPSILTDTTILINAGLASFGFVVCAAAAYAFFEWDFG